MKKKTALSKRELIHSESVVCLPTSMEGLLDHLHKIQSDAKKKGYTDITVDFETEWGYYDDCWVEMKVNGTKPLSVKEFVEGKKQCIRTST